MRSLTILCIFISGLFISCGGSDENADNSQNTAIQKGMVALELTDYGIPFGLWVPDSTVGTAQVTEEATGFTSVRVGRYFHIQIAEGGDLMLRKEDMKNDDVFQSTILEEGDNYIIYKSEIPNANAEVMHHFYLLQEYNGITYEIEDVKSEGTAYPYKAIEKMFNMAKSPIPLEKINS